jgi:fructokinase
MIICCGEALIDLARVQVRGLGEVFSPFPGGSPYNTAIAIGRLGVDVKFLGHFSKDFFGEILVKRLKDNNVGDELLARLDLNTTLAFVKSEKNKEPQYIFYTEGCADRSLSIASLPVKLPPDTRCILFGSISMTMEPIASSIEAFILREGSRKSTDQMDGGPIISFDPNIRPFMIKDRGAYVERFEKWVAAATIVKMSQEDIEFIYPKLEHEQVLQKIIAMGPRLAICTQGPKGALAFLRRNDGSVTKVSAPSVDLPVVDTIGAGDTFHGAFLSWLEINSKMSRSALTGLSEADLYSALFFANKAASIVCSRRGADPPTKREVENLKAKVAISIKRAGNAKKPAQAGQKAKPASSKTAAPKTDASKAAVSKTASARVAASKADVSKTASAKAAGTRVVKEQAAKVPEKKAASSKSKASTVQQPKKPEPNKKPKTIDKSTKPNEKPAAKGGKKK